MTVRLPSNLDQALAAKPMGMLVALVQPGQADVLIKADERDIRAWRNLPVRWQWELGQYPTGAVLRLYLVVQDLQGRPLFDGETFLNPASDADRPLIEALIDQPTINVHFFAAQAGRQQHVNVRSAGYRSHAAQAPQIARMTRMADAHLASIPAAQLDFDAARQAMMADRPMIDADSVQ
jgi:hypothetical protein